jgi:DNA replication protein DnaC
MEHISEILKKQGLKNISADPTDTSSSIETPANNCPLCHGAGFVHPLLSNNRPDYGRVIACQCARKSWAEKRRSQLESYSNLGALRNYTFDKLSPIGKSGDPQSQKLFSNAYEAALEFSHNPAGWMVFIGPSGIGKTHLAAAIANECIKQDNPVFFTTVSDLLDNLKSAFNPESLLPYERFFDQIRNIPLLILDDLGIHSNTPWAQEKLDQLLNHRYNHELPTVVTSDLPIEQMEERWRSRFTDNKLCQVFILGSMEHNPDLNWGPGLELQRNMTFGNFDQRRVNLSKDMQDNLERAYRLALDFAQSPEGWLVLQGSTGCGKTHLAAAIVNFRYQAGKSALFVVVPEFLDHLRSTFSPESKISYDRLFEQVKTTPLLVLDDFGEQSTTPWAQEKLYQVINYRYNAKLPTVITTSRLLEEMEDRISSRMSDHKMSTAYCIIAPDYRTDITSKQIKKPYRKIQPNRLRAKE